MKNNRVTNAVLWKKPGQGPGYAYMTQGKARDGQWKCFHQKVKLQWNYIAIQYIIVHTTVPSWVDNTWLLVCMYFEYRSTSMLLIHTPLWPPGWDWSMYQWIQYQMGSNFWGSYISQITTRKDCDNFIYEVHLYAIYIECILIKGKFKNENFTDRKITAKFMNFTS